nr:MAG TPA: hypothetical protein [Caudoviricetes sp.]
MPHHITSSINSIPDLKQNSFFYFYPFRFYLFALPSSYLSSLRIRSYALEVFLSQTLAYLRFLDKSIYLQG